MSIAIIIALVGTMSGFTWDVLRTRDALVVETQRTRAVNLLFDRLERDLQTAIATGPGGRPGFRGDDAGLTVAVHTVPIRLAAPGRGTAALGAVEWADYAFRDGIQAIQLERWTPGATRVPLPPVDGAGVLGVVGGAGDGDDADPLADDPAAETPADLGARPGGAGAGLDPDDLLAAAPLDPRTIGTNIYRVSFRYHDGRGWRDTFTSGSRGGLPVAVEVSIWFDPWPGAEDDFEADPEFGGALDAAPDPEPLGDSDPLDAFADETAFDDRPPPDRRRIIAVPDARAGERRDALDAAEFDDPLFGDPNGAGDDEAFSPDPSFGAGP